MVVGNTLEKKLKSSQGLVFKNIEKYSVSIFSNGRAQMGFCSGVVMNMTNEYSYVLTCKHCIFPTEETYVNENKVEYTITSTDDDIAYLIVRGRLKNKKSAIFLKRPPEFTP